MLTRPSKRGLITALAVAAVLLTASVAHAASTLPSLDVQLWPDDQQGYSSLLVTATFPDTAKLPLKVQLPLPKGAEVQWSGEILGGDVSKDPTRTPVTVKGAGGDYVEFEITKSRVAQYEAVYDQTLFNGTLKSAKLAWVQTAPASSVNIAVKTPAGAGNVQIQPAPPGAPQQNPQGEKLFVLTPLQLKPGQGTTVTVSYSPGSVANAAGAASRGPQMSPVLVILVVLLGIAVLALFWLVNRQKRMAD